MEDAKREIERQVEAIERDGYGLIPDLLAPREVESMRRALARSLDDGRFGRNDFEGHRTQRIYSLVAVDRVFADLAEHPRILALCDRFLATNYLLTASQAICIHPGETAQSLHTDDVFYPIPRPRKAVSLSTIIALDAFTAENGATQVVPQSHLWSDDEIARAMQPIDFATRPPAERRPRDVGELPEALVGRVRDVLLPAGGAIVFLGTLLHRGGENRSARPRLALSNQSCEPWARQQENFFVSIPRERVLQMSERVQQLLGYSIHPPFMGHAGGRHPLRG